ncbi:MAG: tetratricopeptide repeat protein, partial [Thermoplasmata archaeon]
GESAENVAREFFNNNQKNPYFNDLLARVLYAEGKKEESEKLYRDFISKNSGYETTRYWVNYLYGTGKFEEALAECEKGIKENPADVFFEEMKFNVLRNMEKHDEALAVIQKMYENDKTRPDYGLDYASELSVLKRYDDAISVLNDLQKNYEDYSEVYIEFFRVFNEKGDFDTALNYAAIAMEKADDDETLMHFPEEVIDDGLKASKINEIKAFFDDLISNEDEDSPLRLIYMADKAIITGSTEGYERGKEEIDGITKDKNEICEILKMHREIENEAALKFIKEYIDKECKNLEKDEEKK